MILSPYPLRFFRVVPPVPGLIGWTFLIVGLTGSVAIGGSPERSADAMVPVLLLQLFAASSGFDAAARRGHYDLLLTSGCHRVWMALVHWAASIAPGLIVWLLLVAVEIGSTGHAHAALLASGTIAALILVSTMPWAITVRLPRFSGAIGWLLILATVTSLWPDLASSAHHHASLGDALAESWRFLLYPPIVVGRDLGPVEAASTVPGLMLAVGSMVAACRWVSRARFPLEAAQ